jgi:aryl-alcohol dehydrogenase-like predicted oxidoreductase
VPDDSRLKVWFDDDERAEALADDRLRRVEALAAFAEGRGRTSLELAFGWLLAHDAVASVIAGATTPDQVRANAAAGGWIPDAAALDAMP